MTGLALSAAASYAPSNVRVNVVAPGLVRVCYILLRAAAPSSRESQRHNALQSWYGNSGVGPQR